MELTPELTAAATVLCGAAGVYARHIIGGAPGTHRWEAMILLAIPCWSTLYVYPSESWLGVAITVVLIALLYMSMIAKQVFGNLWWGALRNCSPFLLLAGITGCWEVLIAAPIVFFALKWAKAADDTKINPHTWFEYVLGGTTGVAWSIAPILRHW